MDEITKRAIEGIKPLNEITKPVENIKPLNEIPNPVPTNPIPINPIINKKPIEKTIIKETIIQEKEDKKVEEIDNILDELPVKDVEEPKKIIGQDKKKSKVPKIFSNKIFKYGVIFLGILFLLLLILPSNPDCPEIINKTVVAVEGDISFDLIKEQIVNQGYTEITKDGITIKLSPYIQ